MEVDKVADMEVHMVADMEVDKAANMEVDKTAAMDSDKAADMLKTKRIKPEIFWNKVYWAEAVWCVSSKLCKSIHFHKITKVFVKVNICQKICKKEVKCCNWGKKSKVVPTFDQMEALDNQETRALNFFLAKQMTEQYDLEMS